MQLPDQTYALGDSGPAVVDIQRKLVSLGLLAPPPATAVAGAASGHVAAAEPPASAPGPPAGRPPLVAHPSVFDTVTDRAVRLFQQQRGLTVDGRVDPATYRALDEARWRLGDRLLGRSVSHPLTGDDVAELQRRLSDLGFVIGRVDGIFGQQTESGLQEFQRNYGLVPDGTCGPLTLRALQRLGRAVVGGSPEDLRESERLRQTSVEGLRGRHVLLDPAHGGPDRGVTGHGLAEAEVVLDLAARIESRLTVAGATVSLSRGRDDTLGAHPTSEQERAELANTLGVDLVLSLHVDAHAHPEARGLASFYYGSRVRGGRSTQSYVGRSAAELCHREILARTDLGDCRIHPMSWDLLRLTRMPSVRLDVGYLSHGGDARRLASGHFRDAVADGVLAALERLYRPEDQVATGQLRLEDIRAAARG